MSGIQLTTPYLDTSADQLSFALGLPARQALAVTEVQLGDLTAELRLLGASHQVSAGPVRETLACLPDGPGGGPPAAVTERIDGWAYRFTSHIAHYRPAELTARAAALRQELADRPDALYGVFPGSPDAVTALAVRRVAQVITWRTWHAYPQTGHLVETRTRLEAP